MGYDYNIELCTQAQNYNVIKEGRRLFCKLMLQIKEGLFCLYTCLHIYDYKIRRINSQRFCNVIIDVLSIEIIVL